MWLSASSLSKPFLVHIIHIISLSVPICITFGGSLDNDFAFDDNLAIVSNGDVLSPDFSSIWRHDIWGKDMKAIDSHRSYRPLLILAFKLLFQYFGLNARFFRIFSICAHAVATCLVYVVSYLLFCDISVAWSTSFLFASHPIHVEAVVAVVNMAEALSCIFYIMGYIVYLVSCPTITIVSSKREEIKKIRVFGDILYTLSSLAIWLSCFSLSALFKETGAMLSILVLSKLILDVFISYFRRRREEKEMINRKYDEKNEAKTYTYNSTFLIKQGLWLALLIFAMLGYMIMRKMLVSTLSFQHLNVYSIITSLFSLFSADKSSYLGDSLLVRKTENPFAFVQSNTERTLSIMYLHFRYFLLLLYPYEQSAEYAFDCIKKVDSILDKRNILSFGMYLTIFSILSGEFNTLVVHSNRKSKKIEDEMKQEVDLPPGSLLFAFTWLLIPFVPASAVFLRLGTLLAERLLYIPSIGYCMALSIFIRSAVLTAHKVLSPKFSLTFPLIASSGYLSKFVQYAVVILLTSWYAYKSHMYIPSWKNDTTLFLHTLAVCPESAKVHLQVGKIYINTGDFEKAIHHIHMAKHIDSDFCDVGYQEAIIQLLHYKDMDGAIKLAAENLNCVYTNMHSWELISKLWDSQLQSHASAPPEMITKLLRKQGSIAEQAGLLATAIQKLNAATTTAFEGSLYELALRLSVRAEKLIPRLLNGAHEISEKNKTRIVEPSSQSDSPDERIMMKDLICHVYLLGGHIRSFLGKRINSSGNNDNLLINSDKRQASIGATQFLLDDKLKEELQRTKPLLFRSIEPDCIFLRDGTLNKYALVTMNTISSSLHENFDLLSSSSSYKHYIEVVEDLAKYSTLAISIFEHLPSNEGKAKLNETKVAAFYLWDLVGKRHFKEGNFTESLFAFESAIGVAGGVEFSSCLTLYWYSQALVASNFHIFVKSSREAMIDDITKVKHALYNVINCNPQSVIFRSSMGDSVKTEMTITIRDLKRKAIEQITNIDQLLS